MSDEPWKVFCLHCFIYIFFVQHCIKKVNHVICKGLKVWNIQQWNKKMIEKIGKEIDTWIDMIMVILISFIQDTENNHAVKVYN